ncbi:MAG: hypothetical protein ACTSY1_08660 [Alphaproteobacteria bacterium]
MKKTSIALAALFALGTVTTAMAGDVDIAPAEPTCHNHAHDGHILALPIILLEEIFCVTHLDHLSH